MPESLYLFPLVVEEVHVLEAVVLVVVTYGHAGAGNQTTNLATDG